MYLNRQNNIRIKNHWIQFSLFKLVLTTFILIVITTLLFFYYKSKPIDIKDLPLIKNTECSKSKLEKDDGLIFYNQDKMVYNNITQKINQQNHSKYESMAEDFSYEEILRIVQDIKKGLYISSQYSVIDKKSKR